MVVHICANPEMVTVSTPKAAFGCPHIMRVTMRVEAPSGDMTQESGPCDRQSPSLPAGSAANVLRAVKGSTEPILKPHWCVWTSPLGRQHAMPHIKTYLRHRCGSTLVHMCA